MVAGFFGAISSIVTYAVLAVGIVTFASEGAYNAFERALALRFGVTGYSYYEVDERQRPTRGGNMLLMSKSDGLFESIRKGDRFIVTYNQNLRLLPTGSSRARLIVDKEICLIAVSDRKFAFTATKDPRYSAGWIKVATTPCSLTSSLKLGSV